MERKFKVGIVGVSRGKGYVNVFNAHPRVEVSSICDLDQELLNEVGDAFQLKDNERFTDYNDFISQDFDIVVIATPIPLHTEQTLKALEAGKHILCEQTVAYTVEECEKVIDAVNKSGKTYMMAENYCYFHFIQQWKKMYEAGKFGKIVYAESEYIHNIEDLLINEKTGQRYWRHERPPIWYCAHVVGPILYITDDYVVRATGRNCGFNRWPDKTNEPGFIDMEVALFETKKGMIFKILRSQTAVHHHMTYYCIYGTKGSAENQRTDNQKGSLSIEDEMGWLDKPYRDCKYELVDYGRNNPNAPEEALKGGHGTSEYYLIREFLDAVELGKKPPIDVIKSVEYTVPGIIAHKSGLQEGKWLDVPQYD
jgi:predicted dehydrogenase